MEELHEDELQRFLVDDEYGNRSGNGKKSSFLGMGFRYLSTKEASNVPRRKGESLITQFSKKEASDFFKEPLKLPKGSEETLANIKQRPVGYPKIKRKTTKGYLIDF